MIETATVDNKGPKVAIFLDDAVVKEYCVGHIMILLREWKLKSLLIVRKSWAVLQFIHPSYTWISLVLHAWFIAS